MSESTGLTARGEIAPLPGLSKESLDEAVKQLEPILPLLLGRNVESLDQVEAFMDELSPLFPSVRCGLEMALVSLLAASQKQTLAQFLCQHPVQIVPICFLVRGNTDREVLMDRIGTNSFKENSVKIKLGHQPLEEAIEFIRSLLSILPQTVLLRLDVNRAWDMKPLQTLASSIQMDRIEYIEEPLKELSELDVKGDSLRIALDESLSLLNPAHFVLPPYVSALVLKPMMLGGILTTLKWANVAKKQGRYVVISSSYESPTGLDQLEQLACALQRPGVASGLGTRHVFR